MNCYIWQSQEGLKSEVTAVTCSAFVFTVLSANVATESAGLSKAVAAFRIRLRFDGR